MSAMDSNALKSLGSRAGWTALQAALGVIIVWASSIDVSDEPGAAATIVALSATVLSVLKSFIASKIGDPDTVEFK